MTDKEQLNGLKTPTKENPLRILFSACLLGTLCGADGSSYGHYPHIIQISKNPRIHITSFCPENFVLGTPREIPDIQDGNGAEVLEGKAKVITESGKDVTGEMIKAAEKMLQVAIDAKIELAIMMDVSAACGSQVIHDQTEWYKEYFDKDI